MKIFNSQKITHFFVGLLFISSNVYAFQNSLVRLTSGEWPPYLSQTLPNGGFAAQIISEAFLEMDINIEIGYYPWKRSYQYALKGIDQNNNEWNGTMVWVKTPERHKDFYYSDVVIIDDEVLFHLKKYELDWHSVEDLQGKVLGGTAHTAYPIFEKAQQEGILKLQRGGNYDTLLKRVFHQKIDAAPLVKYVGLYYLNQTFDSVEQSQFTYSPQVIETRYYHLMLTKAQKNNKELIETFNHGLRKLHQNGRYQELMRQLKQSNYQPIKD